MKTNSIGKSFTIEEILKINFQNFHISWKGSKSISWTFLGSLHNETIMKYAFHEMPWKKHFTVYPCLKKCQTFTIEKNWCSQDFDFLRKKFEESYIRGNVYFDIIAFNCLSSAKPCLRFLLICFAREIKDIYQSFLGNEVSGIQWTFPQIFFLKIKIPKNWDMVSYIKSNDYNDIDIFLWLENPFTFCLRRKRPENAFLTLTVNYDTAWK